MTEDEVIADLITLLSSMTDEDREVDPDTPLGEVWSVLGLKSLDSLDFATRIEKRFGFRFEQVTPENHLGFDGKPLALVTLRDVARLVQARDIESKGRRGSLREARRCRGGRARFAQSAVADPRPPRRPRPALDDPARRSPRRGTDAHRRAGHESECRSIRGSRSSPSCLPTIGSPSRERSRRGSIPGSEDHGIPGHGEHILTSSGGCQRGAGLDRAPGPTLRDGLPGEMARVADADQGD